MTTTATTTEQTSQPELAIPTVPEGAAGIEGGATSPGPAPAPSPGVSDAGEGAVSDPPPDKWVCRYCGKICGNKGALGRHEQACKANPDRKARQRKAPEPAPRPVAPTISLDEWKERKASDGASAAAEVIDAVAGEGGGIPEVIARMDAGQVGIPDVIALVCLRALPPELTDHEYAMLRVAYKDSNVQLPPWLFTILITLAVVGPRALAHPDLGPWLRGLLVGSRKATPATMPEPAPEPEPVITPAPAPAPEPEPAPVAEPTDTDAREQIRRAMEAA